MTKTGFAITLATALFTFFGGVGIGIVMEREAHRQAFHAESKSVSAGTERVGTKFHWGPRGIWATEPHTELWATPKTKAAPASAEITPMGWSL